MKEDSNSTCWKTLVKVTIPVIQITHFSRELQFPAKSKLCQTWNSQIWKFSQFQWRGYENTSLHDNECRENEKINKDTGAQK